MALLVLNKKNLQLDVLVGILEKYEPDAEIESIYNKVEELKKETENTITKIVGAIPIPNAVEIICSDEEKKKNWVKFIENVYSVKLSLILEDIHNKNLLICPRYRESVSIKGEKQ